MVPRLIIVVPAWRRQNAPTRPYDIPTLRQVSTYPSASEKSCEVAASADAAGHGCPRLHLPFLSHAATPERRMCVPSAQQNASPAVMLVTAQ
jgi:hypothetical protein